MTLLTEQTKSKLSKAVLGLIASGALAGPIAHQFLQEREGLRTTAYQDGGGVWTICYGHTGDVTPGEVATKEDCDVQLSQDIDKAEVIVTKLVSVPMTEPQRASVISFCAYNLGPGKCKTSTFIKKLNAGDKTGVCQEIKRWIYDGGKDCRVKGNNCAGQIDRRDMESELCAM